MGSAPSPRVSWLTAGSGCSGWGPAVLPLPVSSVRFLASPASPPDISRRQWPLWARVRGQGPAAPAPHLPAGSDSSSCCADPASWHRVSLLPAQFSAAWLAVFYRDAL